jgi:hypothetical protein
LEGRFFIFSKQSPCRRRDPVMMGDGVMPKKEDREVIVDRREVYRSVACCLVSGYNADPFSPISILIATIEPLCVEVVVNLNLPETIVIGDVVEGEDHGLPHRDNQVEVGV